MARTSVRALTLMEVSVAIALVALVVALALPHIVKAQTRAKVTQTIADMRKIGVALEAYKNDNEVYPRSRVVRGSSYRFQHMLTTPIAYIDSVPLDPFSEAPLRSSAGEELGRRTYDYGAMPLTSATLWGLASYGPDRQDSTYPFFFYPGYSPELFCNQVEGYSYTLYDPTNGAISRGDLIRASDYDPTE